MAPQTPQRDGAPPLPNSYWVVPGRLLAGEYPGASSDEQTGERIELLLQAGVDTFVDLTMPGELPAYHARLPLSVEYDRRPIRDHDIPEHFQQMDEIVALIGDALRRSRVLYVHCRAGIGRTGTTMACHLIDAGLELEAALQQLNDLWQQCARSQHYPSVPETAAQLEFVQQWARYRESVAPPAEVAAQPPIPGSSRPQQRFIGALLGLAVGEALGAATHGLARGSFAPVTALQGGGPAQLPRGAWGDDTAMALCLADSLLARAGFDPRDQVARYQRWQTQGYLSATGTCLGLEPNTAKALGAARWRRQLFAGSHDPRQLDPEPLARVAPVVMYFFAEPRQALERAVESARTVCQAPGLLGAMRAVAHLFLAALQGQDRSAMLTLSASSVNLPKGPDGARLGAIVDGRYRNQRDHDLHPAGNALDILESALWVLWHARDFRGAVLSAVNLGGRADVLGALVGQVAGARFGVAGIPAEWLAGLAQRDLIAEYANRMYAAALAGTTS